MWTIIMSIVVIAGLGSGTLLMLHENRLLPRIRRVPKTKTPALAPLSPEVLARSESKRARAIEEKRAEARLIERHASRAADLLEFDYRMEALLPHTEHTPKTRLSPRTGCYDCEQERKDDLSEFRLWVSGI